MKKTTGVVALALTLALICCLSSASPARAWKAGGHVVEAEKVCQQLPDTSLIKQAMQAYPRVRNWGSCGADLGYGGDGTINLGRGYTPWADKLHYQRTGTLARLLLQRALASGDQEQIAFAAGYLTHTTGDLACHSMYVNPEAGGVYFADPESQSTHSELEKLAEPYVWKDLGDHESWAYSWFYFPSNYSDPSAATKQLFTSTVSEVYGDQLSVSQFDDWLGWWFGTMVNPLFSYVGGLYTPYDEAIPLLNIIQPGHPSVTRRENIDAAMDCSVQRAVELLSQAEAGNYAGFTNTWNLDVGERPADEFGELTVRIHTADSFQAGTDDNVWFIMYLADGSKFDPLLDMGELDGMAYDDFEQDDNDWYFIHVPGRTFRPDTVKSIELFKGADGSALNGPEWEPDHISVWVNGRLVVNRGIDKVFGGDHDGRSWKIPVDWSDATPPTTSASTSGTSGLAGWFTSPVSVHLSPTDNISAASACRTCYSFDQRVWYDYRGAFSVSKQGNSTVWYYSTDADDNDETPKQLHLKIDATPPTTSASTSGTSGLDGWFTSPVSVQLSPVDAISGGCRTYYSVDENAWSEYTTAFTIGTQGDCSAWYYSVDAAGNEEMGKRVDFRIDSMPPQITIASPVDGAFFTLLQPVLASWTVSDATSGVATSSGSPADGEPLNTTSPTLTDPLTGTVTHRIVTVAAEDAAGNSVSRTATYRVGYAHSAEFAGPIDANGNSCFKFGSTVPVKFSLANALGASVATAVVAIDVRFLDGTPDGSDMEAVSTAAATTGTLFRYSGDQYIFNLGTKNLKAGDFRITAKLDDGTTISEKISLKK